MKALFIGAVEFSHSTLERLLATERDRAQQEEGQGDPAPPSARGSMYVEWHVGRNVNRESSEEQDDRRDFDGAAGAIPD